MFANTHTVSAFEALSPFAFVYPALFFLNAQAVPLAAHPLALVAVAFGPYVNAAHFVAELPQAGEFAHRFGPCANAVSVRFAVFPAAAVAASVFKVESACICCHFKSDSLIFVLLICFSLFVVFELFR